MLGKTLKILVCVVLAVVIFFIVAWQFDYSRPEGPTWGATFSQYYAKELLKIDWRETYRAILDDLNFKKLRLVAYWEYLEPVRGALNFEDLDWQIDEAEKLGKDITLAVGFRLPRWPECHEPDWAKKLDSADFKKSLLGYISGVVSRYKERDSIKMWQVENEPFLSSFGECPPVDTALLEEEVRLVKSTDPNRPVMITDAGELGLWTKAAGYGDVLGTTLYRIVWNPVIGKFEHFLPPAFYTWRAWLVEKLFGVKDVIIAELQAEPWAVNNASLSNTPFDGQAKNLNLDEIKNILDFAKKTGLKDAYLWGPEWWYYRELNGDPGWMEFGKTLK
jgi:hypothetical protein